MKLTTLIVAAIVFASPVLAENVTFVIPGGTKGLYMSQAVSHTEDLTRLGYSTDIGAPGDTCGAAELVNNSDHPSLFIWGSDYQASAQMGDGCPVPEFNAEDVIAVGYNPVFVCTMDAAVDPLVGDYKLGVWLGPEAIHVAAVNRLNSVAGSNLTPIPYDGSGSALTALTNGEIDVALLPRARAETVKESGGACKYMFANADQDAEVKSLVEAYNDPMLNLTTMDVIVAKNWNSDDAQNLMQEVYDDPASSVSKNPTKYNNNVPDNVMDLWTGSVEAFVTK
jgi:ABC-type amino acid transport substrate-binding protein